MEKILVVEDERPISELIQINLTNAGYACACTYDGRAEADLLVDRRFDLILLDIMLPYVDGFALMEFIKPLDMPVIFLTAKGDVADRVKGLRLGADDYIVKPFAIAELLARVDTVLRRYYKTDSVIRLKNIEVHTQSHAVMQNGVQAELTPKEYELLLLFLQNKNIALFRDVIFERVWQGDYLGDSRTVDLHVQRLRKKLGLEDSLKTVYKVGYRLEVRE